ncbi:hypothetical protein B9Z51_08875 [Limnohabitans sp. T6-5]|uniref:hypothetical protein n=1 Tax=Limnohabitans sp. T6-5 TaxID=1100724 RepID=UPI000DD22B14|nr:hypothetical protein [Limnohabitans sp. T6-5]PUE09033.1 hypothetical protein B9Z51_08875 [Limnohabitans sp. T6-5]
MKERPILFSGPMVRALLCGTKTETRRVVKPQPYIDPHGNFCWNGWNYGQDFSGPHIQAIASPLPSSRTGRVLCPYGKPGDRLWVRETFADLRGTGIEHRPDPSGPLKRFAFAADHPPGSNGDEARKEFGVKWKPSIHMPRAASRITLEITGVRVERLIDISEADAKAEGVTRTPYPDHFLGPGLTPQESHVHRNLFAGLWKSINGADSWAANPWVWVVEFKRLEQPA